MNLPLIRYVLTAAIRDRVVLSVFLLMAVGASLAVFMGSSAVTESDQFAVVFAAGGLRFAGAVGLVLFIVFHLRRSFETRDIDFLLSRPVSRPAFVFSHMAAFLLLALLVALCVSLSVAFVAPQAVGAGHLLWAASLFAEYAIMAAAATFFAMMLPGAAVAAMAVFGFYVLARMIGQILGTLEDGLGVPAFETLSRVMDVIALVVPRLDLMAQTTWLVYDMHSVGYGFVVVQGVLFTVLLTAATLVDLSRRQF